MRTEHAAMTGLVLVAGGVLGEHDELLDDI